MTAIFDATAASADLDALALRVIRREAAREAIDVAWETTDADADDAFEMTYETARDAADAARAALIPAMRAAGVVHVATAEGIVLDVGAMGGRSIRGNGVPLDNPVVILPLDAPFMVAEAEAVTVADLD